MAKYLLKDVRLSACAVVLGEEEHHFAHEPDHFNHDPAQLARLQKMIGFGVRYNAAPGTTTCDLCEAAARRLLKARGLQADDIVAVISVTQTPDYLMPGNAHAVHARLGLPRDCLALDVEMGCSGFVYGLWLAGLMAQGAQDVGRVLLLAGDTLSKAAHPQDRTTFPLFGDAGSATLVEYIPGAGNTHVILRSDGTRLEKMYVPAGAYRIPSSEETRREESFEDGSVRSQDDLYMDGFGIFEFTMTEQPELLRDILAYSSYYPEDIDYFVFHQANRYIVETLARSASVPRNKVPSDIFSRFGNQNSASIPGVLCGALADTLRQGRHRLLLQGFGTGLSWGACVTEVENMLCLEPQRFRGRE